jgi:hypothetical protein
VGRGTEVSSVGVWKSFFGDSFLLCPPVV